MENTVSNGSTHSSTATSTKTEAGSSWWWWWEISAGIVTLISISFVVFLLVKIDQTPRRDWILTTIQPNSLLSVAITTSKTSLLVAISSCISQLKWQHFLRPRRLNELQIFDEASRGPWGSAIMIMKLSYTRIHTQALIGIGLAVVNVLALGIDPSAQQLIALEAKEVRVYNSSVIVSRAGDYYSRSWDYSSNSSPGDTGLNIRKLLRPYPDQISSINAYYCHSVS